MFLFNPSKDGTVGVPVAFRFASSFLVCWLLLLVGRLVGWLISFVLLLYLICCCWIGWLAGRRVGGDSTTLRVFVVAVVAVCD